MIAVSIEILISCCCLSFSSSPNFMSGAQLGGAHQSQAHC
jgi:hypothetical protein